MLIDLEEHRMKIKLRYVVSLLVCLVLCLSLEPGSWATEAGVFPDSLGLTQQTNVTCTLASVAMMLRGRMFRSNNNKWSSVTESSIKPVAWDVYGSLGFNWTYSIDGNSMTVNHNFCSGISVSTLKGLLDSHPEGIVLYESTTATHAVFVCDYVGDTFYCFDPAPGYSGRRTLSNSWLATQVGNQSSILSGADAYWYVSSYSISPSIIYTVTYDANGGTDAPASQKKTPGTTLILSSDRPYRVHTHLGWCNITYDANGGSLSPSVATFVSAEQTSEYRFMNWNTMPDGSGVTYLPGFNYGEDADVTLYAQWETTISTVNVTLPTPTREGYSFKGWATSPTASSGMTGEYTPSGDITLYATWEPTTISGTWGNLNWELNQDGLLTISGNGDMNMPFDATTYPWLYYENQIKDVLINDNVTSIGSYAFLHYSNIVSVTIPSSVKSIGKNAFYDCGLTAVYYGGSMSQWNGISINDGNNTLTSAWLIINAFDVKYDANGGTEAPQAQIKARDTAITLSSSIPTHESSSVLGPLVTLNPNGGSISTTKLRPAVITNYAFNSWNTSANGSGTTYFPGASYRADIDVTLYAQWNSSTTTLAVTLPLPTRDGYTFVGWSTSTSATSGITGSYTPSGDVTLYAIWESQNCSGTWGNLSWTIDDKGLLTISGEGDMDDFTDIDISGWLKHKEKIVSAVIQPGIKSIGKMAFWDCSALSDVMIPASVTTIGEYAFDWCENLTSITIPQGVTRIGEGTFWGCVSLTSVVIPQSVNFIDNYAFFYCDNVTNIYYGGSQEQWKSVSIGNNNDPLTGASIHYADFAQVYAGGNYNGHYYALYMGATNWDYAKYCCQSLGGHLATITSVEEQSFIESLNTDNISMWIGGYRDNQYNWYWVTGEPWSFTHWADGEPNNSEAVVSNENCVAIWPAFWNDLNSNNTYETDGFICEWDNSDFVGTWGNLTWVLGNDGHLIISGEGEMDIFPESLDDAWHVHKEDIRSATICSGITSLCWNAFWDCTNLTQVIIPSSVTSIGDAAFWNCSNLMEIKVDGANQYFCDKDGVVFNRDETEILHFPANKSGAYSIPETVSTIGALSFGCCEGLSSISIPESVTTIGRWAFSHCVMLTDVQIPANVTVINENSFYGCTNLASIEIPKAVTSIGVDAFGLCDSLTDVYYEGSLLEWGCIYIAENNSALINAELHTIPFEGASGTWGDLIWTLDADGLLTIDGQGRGGKMNDFSPESTEAWRAYRNQITSVISYKALNIGAYSFTNCMNLKSFSCSFCYPDNIGDAAFLGCSALDSLSGLDTVNSIGESAFCGSGLTSVNFSDSLLSIGPYAFAFCPKLLNVLIPASVTSIGDWAFDGCSELTAITVDDQNKAFSDIDGVLYNKDETILISYPTGKQGSFVIPSGVKTINKHAFAFCTDLTCVTIPVTATYIDEYAFAASGLTDIYYQGTETQWNAINVAANNEALLNATIHFCPVTPELTLPAALTTIESEAFANGGFASVLIPPTVKTIALDAFGDRTDLIILGTSGSYAETFAGLKHFTFVPAA